MKYVVCYSGGHSSALAAVETVRQHGAENVILLNHDISPAAGAGGRQNPTAERRRHMTIYIAGPMTGIENYNFDRFNAKETELTEKGHQVLNPAKIGILPDYKMYWPINRAMLDGADAIYMLGGWENSPGARKELLYAVKNSIPALFEDDSSLHKMLGYKFHSEAVSRLPDCNTCGIQGKCPHAPRIGEQVRINCHLWEAKP